MLRKDIEYWLFVKIFLEDYVSLDNLNITASNFLLTLHEKSGTS